MTKRLFLTMLTLLALGVAWGAKVNPEPAVITQPDGTQLTVVAYGDEDFHWYTTTDGVLLAHVGNQFYVASISPQGLLMPTTQLAHEPMARSAEEVALVKAQPEYRNAFFTQAENTRKEVARKRIGIGTATPAYFPHMGTPKAMVILVQFADTTFTAANPKLSFDDYLNHEGPLPNYGIREDRNTGSVREYFSDMSQGLFVPSFDVFGPVTLSKEWKYYGENTSAGSDYSSRIQELVREACTAIDDTVDFSAYDSNGDGFVDLVYIIYAGYGENITGNSSDCIWPKAGTMTGGSYDGVNVRRYGLHCELNYSPVRKLQEAPWKRINGIGLFCHEFSHTMGLPDLYPIAASARAVDNQSMEYWDLMDGGEYTDNSYTPTPYTPWEREVMGWTSIPELSDTAQVTLEHDQFCRINADNNEYIILQNIQNEGWFKQLLGHGMLVYRVDYANDVVNMGDRPNNTAGKPQLTIAPADGLLINSYRVYASESQKSEQKPYSDGEYKMSHFGDPYPGTSEVTSIVSIEMNSTTLEKPIYNIQERDGVISFDFLKDQTNGIDMPTANLQGLSTSETYYDLQGRPLEGTPRKGVYIRGNRKWVVR